VSGSADARRDTARLDVWLWRARFFKTRSLAAKAASEGLIRVMRAGVMRRIDRAGAAVAIGDVVIVPAAHGVFAVRIIALGVRRGPAPEARSLYAACAPEV
jgi:ribosome-associated heat shock protein Hsp15